MLCFVYVMLSCTYLSIACLSDQMSKFARKKPFGGGGGGDPFPMESAAAPAPTAGAGAGSVGNNRQRMMGGSAPFGTSNTNTTSNAGSGGATAGAVGGAGGGVLDKVYSTARKTGVLSLSERKLNTFLTELTANEPEVGKAAKRDPTRITKPSGGGGGGGGDEKWWEQTDLKSIDLSHNAIPSVPSGIGSLNTLQILLLGHNKLQSLPAEIAALTNLKKLDRTYRLYCPARGVADLI